MLRNLRPLVILFAVLAAPLVFLVAVRLLADDELEGVTIDPEPMVVTPTERVVRDQQRVNVALEWVEGRVLRAPPWSGTITEVRAPAGEPITQGQPVVAIDGVFRIAYASPSPFYRSLASGDRGPDVAMLHEMLLELGYIDARPADPSFLSFGSSLAVGDLNAAMGVASSRVFDPGTVIWLPVAPFPVATLDLIAGAPAPSPGSVIATEPPLLAAATLQPQSANEPIALEPGVPYVLIKGESSFAFDQETLTLPGESLAAFTQLVEPVSGPSAGAPGGPGDGGGGLAEQTDALLERATPLQALSVPATAVMTGGDGTLCAWVVDASDGVGYRAVTVTVASSRAGVTDVVSGLSLSDEVLSNPAAVLAEAACPSN